MAAAQAALADAQQQERQVPVQQRQTDAMRAAEAQAVANAAAAAARFGQTRIFAPASGIVTLRAARQGEVVNPGSPIVTLFDLSSTWVDADVEETYADLIAMGQTLRVRLPSGAEITGPVIYKAVEADFATQRDVSRTKRDIKTVAIRVRVANPEGKLPLGMTAWVMLPVPALAAASAGQHARRISRHGSAKPIPRTASRSRSKASASALARCWRWITSASRCRRGEIFGLLGPNGAGKSTLIRMLTTLVPPTSGTAIVAGHDIIRDPNAVRASIGVIPQNMTSDPELTCAENLGIHARLYGITGARRRQRTAELLEAVGLSDRANALAATLSGGMRRRLEIARGMVHDPQILFLDEPTTGLDPVSRISVWEMITHLRAQQGRTLFLTTHYMDEADRLCDRVAIVDRGRIVALDTPVALKASVPGASRIEVQFEPDLPHGAADLESLPAVKSVRALGSATYRISSDRGPASAQELIELAREHKLELKSLSVQSTSLDDVFLHYTGHGLAEMAEAAAPPAAQREEAPDEASFGPGRARYAQVPPQPGADLRLAGAAAGAVGHPGQRLRRQYQERHPGRGQPRSRTGIGGCAGARARRGRQRAHLPAHRLRRRGRRPQRPAQGRAERRS